MSTIKTIEGNYNNASARYVIAVARFNSFIVDHLLEGAIDVLRKHGVMDKDIMVIKVPGAFELPLAVQKPHFEYVAGECVKGLSQVSLASSKPVSFGVLTVDSIEQAIERAGTKAGNKGAEAAITAIEMVSLLRQLEH